MRPVRVDVRPAAASSGQQPFFSSPSSTARVHLSDDEGVHSAVLREGLRDARIVRRGDSSLGSAGGSGSASSMSDSAIMVPASSGNSGGLLLNGGGGSSVELDTLLVSPVGGGNGDPDSLPAHMRGSTPGGGNWKVFEQGMRFGCMLSLLAWVMWDCIVDARLRPAEQDLWIQLVLPVYRGLGCVVLACWCWGCSLYIWERYHINYVYLFELDVRPGSAHGGGSSAMMPYADVLDESVNITIVFLANFLLYFKIMRGDFPAWVNSGSLPLLFVVYMVLKLLPIAAWIGWSSNGIGHNRNAALWAGLGQVPLAPCGKVTFLTGLIGDVWTSMVRVSVDLAYTVCFLLGGEWMIEMDALAGRQEASWNAALTAASVAGTPPPDPAKMQQLDTCFTSLFFKRALIPLLSALPLWFRFMQCLRKYLMTKKRWPNIGNACKYALAHSVVLFGVFNSSTLQEQSVATSMYKACWLLCMVGSTLYTYWWDVYMDWGLGRWEHGLLRGELMYPNKGVYYAAMVVDLGMRFAWTLTFIPQGEDSPLPADFMLVRRQPRSVQQQQATTTAWIFSVPLLHFGSRFNSSMFYAQPMLAAGEILRRTMWAFFRLEYEHICTQASYHRVPDSLSQPAASSAPEMSGAKVIMEVAILVVMVLSVGVTAALSAN